MRVTFLHTSPNYHEINNLILDISLNVNNSDFTFFEYPCIGSTKNLILELFNLRKHLKKNKIDIIHTYNYIDAYFALLVSKGLNVKVVFSDYFYHDDLKGLKNVIYRKVLKKVDYIIFQSESQKKYSVSNYKLNPDKYSKLFHAFCFKRYDSFEFNSVRDEFFIDDFRYLIGTIGDFEPQRDMMSVFKMIKKLRRSGRNFTCVVAGDQIEEYDSYYNTCKYYYLMQGLDNYITYIGRRKDAANLLSQLDVFVYNSAKEAVAIPVMEAMVSGINVVVNDCDIIREITGNGKYASLYAENDDADFANKTRNVLLDLEDYKLISQVVKEETRMIFSIERHIYGLKNIYSKIIDTK